MKRFRALLKLFVPLAVVSFLISGCSNKPFLTPNNSYAIVTYDSQGNSHSVPIHLSWNTNTAVLRQLLVEASFVLTDLRSPLKNPSQPADAPSSPGEVPSTPATAPPSPGEALSSSTTAPPSPGEALSTPATAPPSPGEALPTPATARSLPKEVPSLPLGVTFAPRKEPSSVGESAPSPGLLSSPLTVPAPERTTYLQATFPETTMLTFSVDGLNVNLGIQSIEIEVEGNDLGQVVLNHAWVLQGIANPNLYPAYLKLVDVLQSQTQGKPAL